MLHMIHSLIIVICYKKVLSTEGSNFTKEIRSIQERDVHGHALVASPFFLFIEKSFHGKNMLQK